MKRDEVDINDIGIQELTMDHLKEIKEEKEIQESIDMFENFKLFCFTYRGEECAFIVVSEDDESEDDESEDDEKDDFTCIDYFEVFNRYKGQGIGKACISYLLKEYNDNYTLNAKDDDVSKFWKKCGFECEDNNPYEIIMSYEIQ